MDSEEARVVLKMAATVTVMVMAIVMEMAMV